MLQMDLIDAAGDTPGAEDDDEEEERAARRPGAGPPEAEPRQESAPRGQGQGQGQSQSQGSGDTYRPKRPTTLNLFPQVPRSQVRHEQRGAGLKGRRPRGWVRARRRGVAEQLPGWVGLAGTLEMRRGAAGEGAAGQHGEKLAW